MTSADSPSKATFAVDTGPLLCFGHVNGGVRLVRNRYFGRLKWTEAVMKEIAHHAQRSSTDRDAKELAKAAAPWHGRDASLLGVPHQFIDRTEVDKMRERVRAAANRPPRAADADLGESETLLLAQDRSMVALVDENAARKVARNLGITAHCTLDVLIAEYQDGRLPLIRLKAMWEQLRSSNLDGGAYLPSDKGSLRRWPTPAPS